MEACLATVQSLLMCRESWSDPPAVPCHVPMCIIQYIAVLVLMLIILSRQALL